MSGMSDGLVENRADLVVVSYRFVGGVSDRSVLVKTREDLLRYLDFLKRCVIIFSKN